MAHSFTSHLEWTGAGKGPTRDPISFSRDLRVSIGATTLEMSSAPSFRGDAVRANPEQLFVASLSACQALTYLFAAARNGIAVVGYSDEAEGWLEPTGRTMHMSRVTLRPHIVLRDGADAARARELVDTAHAQCFIGRSVTTHVVIEPKVEFASTTTMVA
ncbi:MAG TPA: OsmC family protein [Vicinamibacterales bacterium]|jgi:organic hydroperoxide reductase OsmC/OhrA